MSQAEIKIRNAAADGNEPDTAHVSCAKSPEMRELDGHARSRRHGHGETGSDTQLKTLHGDRDTRRSVDG